MGLSSGIGKIGRAKVLKLASVPLEILGGRLCIIGFFLGLAF